MISQAISENIPLINCILCHQNQLIADTKNSDLERQDVAQLLEVISQAVPSGKYWDGNMEPRSSMDCQIHQDQLHLG